MRSGNILLLVILLSVTAIGQNFSTRGELETQARDQMRMVADTFVVNNARMARFARAAEKAVDFKLRPNRKLDTIITTGGTAGYSLNSDCYENGVVGAKIMRLNGKWTALRSAVNKDIGQGISADTPPYWYVQWGGYISLEPTPQKADTIVILYEARSREFSADVDSTADSITTIPPEHDCLIVDYMRYLIAKRLGLEGLADEILNRWKTDVAEARALIQARPDLLVPPETERGQ